MYEDLNAATTDELVAIWHENNRAEWTDMEFEVLEGILTERLGKLPRRGKDQDEEQEIDDQVDPKIQQLWMQGDVDALRRIMEGDPDVPMRLEAAEALADLGDEDGLDFLIEMLDDTEEEHDEMAAEMLDWLDLPRGNEALRERGYAFETNGANLIEAQETRTKRQVARPEARETWTFTRSDHARRFRGEQPAGTRCIVHQLAGRILTGAAGGVLGFLFACVGLDLLGMKPLPAELQGWLEPAMVYWLIESLVVGAVAGNIGSRTMRTVARGPARTWMSKTRG